MTAEVQTAQKAIEAPVYKLTHADRCDCAACGSRAYVRATYYGGQLLFCNHHFNERETAIRRHALEILDERSHLIADVTRKPSDGAFA